jgi:hypothetical protein
MFSLNRAMASKARPANQRATNRKRAVRAIDASSILASSSDNLHHHHPPSALTMPALANSARAVARSWTAHQMPVARAGVTAMQTRNASASSFDSPFKGSPDSTKIPSFAAYRNKNGEQSTKVFQYFMVGTMGALSALGAKATVQGKHPPAEPQSGDRRASKEVELQTMAYWELSGSNWPFCG